MPTPGSGQEHDEHHSLDRCSHGIAVFGDHVLFAGGNFTTVNHIYSSLPVSSHQQQVLDILWPPSGPSRIDGKLLHNSREYEDVRLRGSQQTPDEVEVYSIFQKVIDDLPPRGTIHHESSHYIRKGRSKHVSIPVAERLAVQRVLLATIILPDSTPLCATFIVPTLAYQLVQNIPSSAEYVLGALRSDPGIFERNTETQFKQLFKIPLEMAYMNASIAEKVEWPNTIVLDGNAREFALGSVAHWILQSFSDLPVNTVTHIGVESQDRGIESGPRSPAQRFRKLVLLLIHQLRS